jgi:hypothetical protein
MQTAAEMNMLDIAVEQDDDQDGPQIDEYDITSVPNDFNVTTIVDFIRSGAVQIPGFQRNFVWDIRRASKLIESLIIGLPVPQVFLYEEERNSFLVIDGQQRLMSLYYFVVGRFPRKDKRVELRGIFNEGKAIPEAVLADNELFEDFRLKLPELSPGRKNKFNRLSYEDLGDYKTQFDLRTIRNVIVKQVRPSDDRSSIYEIFNRLNTGGVLLTPQEIRSSLFHSPFFDELFKLNLDANWRRLLGSSAPDDHMADVEILLRGIAMWQNGDQYSPSMVKFLNSFSKEAKSFSEGQIRDLVIVVTRFFELVASSGRGLFLNQQGQFSVPLFESVFTAACEAIDDDPNWLFDATTVAAIQGTSEYVRYTREQTASTMNVLGRIGIARQFIN